MNNYKVFKERLIELNNTGEIKIFYRGISKEDAFRIYKVNSKDFQIEQFAEKLFFLW